VLALVTLFVYLPAFHYGFVRFDDPEYVSANPIVQAGWTAQGFGWAFTTMTAGNWHPLTWLSLMLDRQWFGPGAHHGVNVLLHAANAVLLLALLLRLTGAFWESALAAALFAWHPLRVESVVWISERKDVLSAFFGLLALLAYTAHARCREGARPAPRGAAYGWALACFALGLLAKPMLVTLPFAFLLLDYWPLGRAPSLDPRRREWRALLLEKVPFFVLAAASCAVTLAAQHHAGAVVSLGHFPPSARLENALIAYVRYVQLSVWPSGLAVFYPVSFPVPALEVPACALALAAATALALATRTSRPYLVVGWLWFLGMLVPVIGLVQVGSQSLADRYTYLPQIGLWLAAAFALGEAARKTRWGPVAAGSAASLALAACLWATVRQIPVWRDSETLFRHAMDVSRNNFLAENNLGAELDDDGRPGEAVPMLEDASRLNPRNPDIHNNLGLALERTDRVGEAVEQFQEAARLETGSAKTLENLGNALLEAGRPLDALPVYRKATDLDPGDADALNNLGLALLESGRAEDAIGPLDTAIRLNPGYPQAHADLGAALGQSGQLQNALKEYATALRLEPALSQANSGMGTTLLLAGRPADAIPYFKRALQENPNLLRARSGLARAKRLSETSAGRPR
jgi:tetratricopeptide (TPR) repeat protein